jgi:hypothetical protein
LAVHGMADAENATVGLAAGMVHGDNQEVLSAGARQIRDCDVSTLVFEGEPIGYLQPSRMPSGGGRRTRSCANSVTTAYSCCTGMSHLTLLTRTNARSSLTMDCDFYFLASEYS